ncbi:hypothetical protein LguiA_020979 [Lonicera macranthoides]
MLLFSSTVEKIPLLLPPSTRDCFELLLRFILFANQTSETSLRYSSRKNNKSNSGGKQREQSTADRPTDETPYLNLSTNISLDCVDTSYILSEATSTFTKLIGKPEAYVMIMLKDLCHHLVGLSSQQPTVN